MKIRKLGDGNNVKWGDIYSAVLQIDHAIVVLEHAIEKFDELIEANEGFIPHRCMEPYNNEIDQIIALGKKLSAERDEQLFQPRTTDIVEPIANN